jgi:hypothetical protein
MFRGPRETNASPGHLSFLLAVVKDRRHAIAARVDPKWEITSRQEK